MGIPVSLHKGSSLLSSVYSLEGDFLDWQIFLEATSLKIKLLSQNVHIFELLGDNAKSPSK